MNTPPPLGQIAHRLLTQEAGKAGGSADIPSVAVTVLTTLFTSVSSLVGVMGSTGLLRRSLKITAVAFPCYAEVLRDKQNGLLDNVGLCLRKQAPDKVGEASCALVTAYVELLATFIGHRLTMQLLQETWPDLETSSSQEKHA